MNNDAQVNDLIESLKSIIGDLAYRIAYKDAIIAAQERQLEEFREVILNQKNIQGEKVNNDDVR